MPPCDLPSYDGFPTILPRLRALLAALPLAAIAGAQTLVLPDVMNLGLYAGSTSVFRTTGGRFQIAYDSTHFTNAGVTGPIVITRLRFRAEDGQRDLGGHTFTGVTVEVGDSAVDHAAMSTTFASNRGPMGVAGTTNVTVLPASGTVPNDYVVDIDLVALGAQWLYDPTIGTDLLIDVSFTAPAPTTNLVPFSSCPLPTARGRMVSTAAAGPTGTISTAPATVLVDFAGPGGHAFQTPARVERYGAGCGQGLRSFYQDFQIAETFDLANRTLTLTPDNVATPTGYTVAAGSAPPDLTKVNVTPNSTGDEGLVTHALGFTFAWPGGSTSTIKASTNGFVWLDAAATGSDLSPTVLELLGTNGEPARLAPCWYDFHCGRNTGTHPNSGLHVLTDTSAGPGNAVCYVTWANIGVFNQNAVGGTSVSTMQCVLHEATGVAELRIGQMHVTSAQLAITGFSPGRVAGVTSMHPGPHDLSDELPFTTSPDGAVHALTHNAAARPVLGAPFTLQAYNQPAGTVVGALLAGFTPQVPAIAMAPLAPGCGASLFLPGMATVEAFVAPAGTVTSSPLMIPHPFVGAQLFTQYAALDALGNVYTSNGLRLTAGLN